MLESEPMTIEQHNTCFRVTDSLSRDIVSSSGCYTQCIACMSPVGRNSRKWKGPIRGGLTISVDLGVDINVGVVLVLVLMLWLGVFWFQWLACFRRSDGVELDGGLFVDVGT